MSLTSKLKITKPKVRSLRTTGIILKKKKRSFLRFYKKLKMLRPIFGVIPFSKQKMM
jgi:hypothetical protein